MFQQSGSKNTYTFGGQSTFQTKTPITGNPFQSASSSSTSTFQTKTPGTGNLFQPASSSSTSTFQSASSTTQSGFTMPTTSSASNPFQLQQPSSQQQTQQPAQQPAQQPFNTGFSLATPNASNTFGATTNTFTQPVQTPQVAPGFTQADLDNHFATCGVAVTTPDTAIISQREKEFPMWCASVRRDIYNMLLHPHMLNSNIKPDAENRAVLIAKKPPGSHDSQINMFVFIDNECLKGLTLPAEWSILSDELLINAIDHMGELSAFPLAILKAFEKYLEYKIKKWTCADVDKLSIQFLLCFGRELYPRLDINNRMRSRELTAEERLVINSEPYAQFRNAEVITKYQSAAATS